MNSSLTVYDTTGNYLDPRYLGIGSLGDSLRESMLKAAGRGEAWGIVPKGGTDLAESHLQVMRRWLNSSPTAGSLWEVNAGGPVGSNCVQLLYSAAAAIRVMQGITVQRDDQPVVTNWQLSAKSPETPHDPNWMIPLGRVGPTYFFGFAFGISVTR